MVEDVEILWMAFVENNDTVIQSNPSGILAGKVLTAMFLY